MSTTVLPAGTLSDILIPTTVPNTIVVSSEIPTTTQQSIAPDVIQTTTAGPVSPQEVTLAPLINEFSIRLCESLARKSNETNIFVSPFSVSTVLSILLLAARGSSFDQLKHGLDFDLIDSKNENPLEIHSKFQQLLEQNGLKKELLLSNLVYTNRPENGTANNITNQFQELARKYYGAKLEEADFATAGDKVMNDVNSFVNESTSGLIDSILNGPPDAASKILLLNAIYFKGRWARPFNKDITKESAFFNEGVTNTTAKFMSSYGQDYKHVLVNVSGELTDVAEIPYEGDSKSMIILLPQDKTGLSRIMSSSSMVPDVTAAVKAIASAHTKPVNLEIPKFKLETEYNLNEHLSGLGISDIFQAGKADLSGMDGTKDQFVSLVKHKAVVEVNEEGTVAAAVTSVEVKVLSFIQPIHFYADRPFLFLIRDTHTGLILFIGKINHL